MAAPYQIVAQKRGKGWLVAIIAILSLLALSLFSVYSCTALFGGYGSTAPIVTSPNTVAVIDIDGTIQYDGSACSPEGLSALLEQASNDDNIEAVVLRVNSGGGTATAGEEMADLVGNFSKPIVVSSASINASAAYEISSRADYIYVAKTSEIGSIGTMMQITDISGLLDMLGIDIETIGSTENKGSTAGYRPLTEEERQYYQAMVDQINETFIQQVAAGRNMAVDEVRALATGMVFTGLDAVQNGLADEIGTREDAIAMAAKLADLSSYTTLTLGFTSPSFDALDYLLGAESNSRDSAAAALRERYGCELPRY